jgi:phytoene dehydrogenase-like protein
MTDSTCSSRPPDRTHYDNVIIGGGHNGLIAACYLAAAGQSVLVLERNDYLGGATASQRVFADYEAYLSRYAYLVSLLPPRILDDLRISFHTRRRRIASFTPYHDGHGAARALLLSNEDESASRRSLVEMCGSHEAWSRYQRLRELEAAIAGLAWPSMLERLRHRDEFTRGLRTDLVREAWASFVDQPLGEVIERHADHDALRGLLLTDGKIGVFTSAHDPGLLQNRCFLLHVIGNGTGEWRVPVGGMRALVDALVRRATELGVEHRVNAAATHLESGGRSHTVSYRLDGADRAIDATRVLVNATPRVFQGLLGRPFAPAAADEGSCMKVNMLLRRLPRLTCGVSAAVAFAGSLHVDEGYAAMELSYRQARDGRIPDCPPAEIYCHTLTDDSILSPQLRQEGYHTLTLFGLDAPYRLFRADPEATKARIAELYLAALDRLCAEPFADCLARDREGRPCIEVRSPVDLERDVGLDLGNIFHREPGWFFTDDRDLAGTWGVETPLPRVYLAGSSAPRGGGVSGIPGHNAARCILEGG